MKGGGTNKPHSHDHKIQDRPIDGKIGTKKKINEIMDVQGITKDEATELAYANDSQIIMSIVNSESLAILGSLVTRKGRDIKFMDGILSPPGKESPLTKLVAISTHHTDLINTITVMTHFFTSPYVPCLIWPCLDQFGANLSKFWDHKGLNGSISCKVGQIITLT